MFRTMPFGKFEGVSLRDLPDTYLSWCLRQPDFQPAELRRDLEAEARRRRGGGSRGPASGSSSSAGTAGGIQLADLRGILASWFRELALAHHPDRGGDPKVMTVLNAGYAKLRQRLNL
jgi:hypothetical protein